MLLTWVVVYLFTHWTMPDEYQPCEFELTAVNKILSPNIKSEREKLAVKQVANEKVIDFVGLYSPCPPPQKKDNKLKGIYCNIRTRKNCPKDFMIKICTSENLVQGEYFF